MVVEAASGLSADIVPVEGILKNGEAVGRLLLATLLPLGLMCSIPLRLMSFARFAINIKPNPLASLGISSNAETEQIAS